ncbi:unnamed protein product [Larinioides sclopetarius]|uniref:Uncharacterized protein n=2 Tax=Larinioides sclopetarius TaxID=280406 RepID=A0AAV2BU16_9ARAC
MKPKMLTATSNSDRKTATPAVLKRDLTDTPMLMASTEPSNTSLTNTDSEPGSRPTSLEPPSRTLPMLK